MKVFVIMTVYYDGEFLKLDNNTINKLNLFRQTYLKQTQIFGKNRTLIYAVYECKKQTLETNIDLCSRKRVLQQLSLMTFRF